ncbi:hypothetical protein FNF31_00836 [Cafeteria roenbergensis]|nr:hypothetical protein FNF31_00836 [Cafeteria roenbergensis]
MTPASSRSSLSAYDPPSSARSSSVAKVRAREALMESFRAPPARRSSVMRHAHEWAEKHSPSAGARGNRRDGRQVSPQHMPGSSFARSPTGRGNYPPADSAAAPAHRAELFSPIGGHVAAALDSPPPPPPPPADRATNGGPAAALASGASADEASHPNASLPADEQLDSAAPLSARLAAVERSISARLAAIDRQVQQDVIDAGYAADARGGAAEPTTAAGLRAERQRRFHDQRHWGSDLGHPAAAPAPVPPPPALSAGLRDRPTSRFSSLAASLTTHRRPSTGLPDASALRQLLAADEAAGPGHSALSVTDEERDRIWRAERERDAAKSRASAAERAAMVGARALINYGSLAVYRKRYGDQPGVALAGQGSAAAAAVSAADAAAGSGTNGTPAEPKLASATSKTASGVQAAPVSSPRRLSRAPRDVDVSVKDAAAAPRRSSSATRAPADRSATRLADEAFSRRLTSVRQGAGRSQSAHRRATIGGSRHAAPSSVRVGGKGKPKIRRSLADIVRASRALTTDADGNFVIAKAQ